MVASFALVVAASAAARNLRAKRSRSWRRIWDALPSARVEERHTHATIRKRAERAASRRLGGARLAAAMPITGILVQGEESRPFDLEGGTQDAVSA